MDQLSRSHDGFFRKLMSEPQRLIISILFYHGKRSWEYKPIGQHFGRIDKALKEYLPDFDYLYLNIREQSDKEIKAFPNPLLANAILVMKHFYDQSYLLNNMRVFLIGSMDEQGNFYKPLVVYLFDKLREQTQEIQEAMSDVPTPLKSEAMSILDAYEAKGKAEGKAEGKSEKTRETCINMIKNGFANEVICQILEVEEEYVDNLRAVLAK